MTTKTIERPAVQEDLFKGQSTSASITSPTTDMHSDANVPLKEPAPPEQRPADFVVMDSEIQNLVKPPFSFDEAWRLGLAVLVTWNQKHGFKDWFVGEGESLLGYLASFDQVVGFNTVYFDYRVIDGDLAVLRGVVKDLHPEASKGIRIPYFTQEMLKGKTVDMLLDVEEALGYRLKLEALTEPTLGRSKSMAGVMAPIEWQKRDRHRVIGYCRDDVALERDLYLSGIKNGRVVYNDGKGGRKELPIRWRTR